jgi:hypothetical protein
MQTRIFVVACLALVPIACDQQLPTAPYQSTTASTSGVAQWSNVVRDDRGNPITGATINFWPNVSVLLSNEAGRFPLPDGYVEMVFASKTGYESDQKYLDAPTIELTLHDIIRVSVGQSARLTIGPWDAPGGMPPEPYRTRVVRVVSNETVTAQIQVIADDNGPAEYWIQDNCGDRCLIRSALSTFRIAAGAEHQMRIRTPNSLGDRTFTVAMSRLEQ